MKYSEILLPSSSLTVSVNDIPVETIQLKATQSNSLNWEIDTPRSIIKNAKNIINIGFTGYLKISDDVCADLENKGNWLTIAGDSRVTYDYVYRNSVFELKHFPQSFINKQSLVTDKITLLLPADLSLERFAPYLKLVNILTRDASWRGVDFELVRFQGFDNLPKDTNSILIGTADTFNFDNLPISLPLRNQHQQWVEDSDLPLAAGKGFVALMPNPNDSTKALMIISANDDHGLENINYGALSYQAVLPGFYMAGPPGEQMQLNRDASIMSLKRLGYTDGIVYGDEKQTLSYQFNINHDHADAPVKLVLHYSHSPFTIEQQ